MKCTIEQIGNIVMKNPNKGLIEQGKKQADKLMLHLCGVGMDQAISACEYFENSSIAEVRKKYSISNKDLFARLLQQEDMIFSANGGSTYFGLPADEENSLNSLLNNVRYELPLRKWMRNFALPAYRTDPMGIIFMEIEAVRSADGLPMNAPKCYPTYKSIYSIFDYLPNGRRLEYVCFQLTVGEAISFGVNDSDIKDMAPGSMSPYFRLVDDEKDIVVKKLESSVIIATNLSPNPIRNQWDRTPAFILSDLVLFNNPNVFVSPLDNVVELADCFLNDRSIRDLQKKFHGFAKAIEPLLQCGTCAGQGFLLGGACPDCTPAGATKGTGYKLKTKISDVTKFPLEMLKDVPSFDFSKIFGYVSPDIKGWEKQDSSLADLEDAMEMTHWGTARMIRQQAQNKGDQKTATEVSINIQPRYARLNTIADWAENSESMIADFYGEFYFEGFKQSQISYGRNYVLETPDELMGKYQDMRTKGASETALDDVLTKYYSALYSTNPVQLAICKKLMMVEPFVHLTAVQCSAIVGNELDKVKKVYFGDWKRKSVSTDQLLNLKVEELDALLTEYVQEKYQQILNDQAVIAAQQQQETTTMGNIRTDNRVQQAAQ